MTPPWRFANRWRPPDWRTEMVTASGETYADWRRERGLEDLPEHEEVGQVPPPVTKGTDDLPLFRGMGRSAEMGRGLRQEMIEKAKQEVSLDDCFCFECKRCGHCCFRCEIVLTPYDILRLCQGVRITTAHTLRPA